MALGLGSAIVSEVVVAGLIALVLFIIFKVGKVLLKALFGLITNAILGLIAMFALNYIFNIGIPIGWATIVPTILFGLPSVGTMVILRLFGIPL